MNIGEIITTTLGGMLVLLALMAVASLIGSFISEGMHDDEQ